MHTSLLSAGRVAHLKIVGVALAFATIVVLVGMNAKSDAIATMHDQAPSVVIKAGQPATYAGQETSAIR